MEGEYEAPGWDRPCPRLDPNGRSSCEHRASEHAEDGVCITCRDGPSADFRPCARPIPESERGRDPLLMLLNRDVLITRLGSTKPICGRLRLVNEDSIVLDEIEEPVRGAYNGGTYQRREIQNIDPIQDSWRVGRESRSPQF